MNSAINLPAAPDLGSPSATQAIADWRRDPGVWVIVLAGLLLWWADYPPPHVDDLFFTGTAVELAQSGRLANPWISPWMESLGTSDFLSHPPVHPYALALWIWIFGVSSTTLTAFHLLVQSLLELGLYRLGRAAGLPWFSSLAMAAIAGLFTLSFGLRPEGLALLLLLASQLCLTRSHCTWWLLGSLLAAGAVLTHLLAMAFVIPLHVLRTVAVSRRRNDLVAFCAATVLGLGLAFACFALAVHGQVLEFFRVLSAYSRLLAPSWQRAPAFFWGEATLGWEPWTLGPILLLIGCSATGTFARSSQERLRPVRNLWLVWLAAVLLGIFLYPTRMVHYAADSGLILAIVSWTRSRWVGPVTAIAIVAVTLRSANLMLPPIFGRAERPDAVAVRQIVRQQPEKVLCLDEVAARYVFDFRLPVGARSWSHRQAAPLGCRGTIASKPAGELWVLNEWKLEMWVSDSAIRAERLRFGKLTFGSVAAAPFRVKTIE